MRAISINVAASVSDLTRRAAKRSAAFPKPVPARPPSATHFTVAAVPRPNTEAPFPTPRTTREPLAAIRASSPFIARFAQTPPLSVQLAAFPANPNARLVPTTARPPFAAPTTNPPIPAVIISKATNSTTISATDFAKSAFSASITNAENPLIVAYLSKIWRA